ncbi:MAG: hypothetical protein NTY53_25780, partial [Kiritimatiellaeota bacterium]|nr:hypothetical protein [Kiritimatiellota bacterium]
NWSLISVLRRLALVAGLCMLSASAAEKPAPAKFTPPFAVRDGVIRDAVGREVRLWGVNYYAPFAHNFLNIAEVGADYRKAIAEDVAQFKLLGLDFVRIHVYDREITDAEGHLTPNRHLEVFDMLLEELDRAGIFLMLTPVVWWNTPENQALMDRHYAFWHVGVGGSFGFANFFSKDEMTWNEDAIRCQERYVAELLAHRSSISGRRYGDFASLIAVEPINEPNYVDRAMLTKAAAPRELAAGDFRAESSGAAACERMRQLWETYRTAHPGEETQVFKQFRGELVQRYLKRMYAVIDRGMGHSYLHVQSDRFMSDASMRDAIAGGGAEVLATGCYPLGANQFDSSWNDHLNFFDLLNKWNQKVADEKSMGFPRIIYEFDAPSTLEGYPFGAMALAFAARHAQMAAMFTYTPTAVAAYNPGWRIHYLNLLHTPARAVAFAAAGEIFRCAPVNAELPTDSQRWQGTRWALQRTPDITAFAGDSLLIHSGKLPGPTTPAATPSAILASGSSRFVTAEGNGAYSLQRTGAGAWELTVFPNERMVNDPFRGRSFRSMANRYINVNEWPVVSRLLEEQRRFAFHLGEKALVCTRRGETAPVSTAADGSFLLAPGTYDLR